MTEPASPNDALSSVAGQRGAVALLRAALANPVHAFLFVGPRGSGKRNAARAFAADLLAAEADAAGDQAAADRHRRLTLAESHPDLVVIERTGPSISAGQAREVVTHAVRSPVEGARKVLLLDEFHLVENAAPILLKTIEEPPPSTFFLVVADEIPPELVTIASRCMLVRFDALTSADVAAQLVAEGVEPPAAERAAEAAGGDIDRARILVGDAGLDQRVATWRSIPDRLDGTGSTVTAIVAEVLAQLEEALAPMDAAHRSETAEAAARAERYGMTKGSAKALEDRQRRERRRFRTDELRFGLAVLARAYRDRLVAGRLTDLALFGHVSAAAEALDRNPNETLLLEALLVTLMPLR